MGLFNKKEGKRQKGWERAHRAKPRFYARGGKPPVGVFALTETVDTVLPKNPRYKVDNTIVEDWKICFVGLTHGEILGTFDFFQAMQEVKAFVVDDTEESMVLRGMSLDEMKALCDRLMNAPDFLGD